MNKGRLITSLLCGLVGFNTMVSAQERPKLLVGIVVDQLRTDYIELLQNRLGDKGFQRLVNEGIWFKDVDFAVTDNSKGVGTAIAYTGAYPMLSGIVDDAVSNPSDLLITTLSDEVILDSEGFSSIYSIATDPATAIIMGGHKAHSAAWLDTNTGKWATSSAYRQGLPIPLSNHNHKDSPANTIDRKLWSPLLDSSSYTGLPSSQTSSPFLHTFPRSDRNVYSRYTSSPLVNDEITDIAIDYINQLRFGEHNGAVDMLNIGYTLQPFFNNYTNDYRFELQDAYLRLDEQLGRLMEAIDKKVGLDNTVIFLTSTGYFNDATPYREDSGLPGGNLSIKRMVSLLNAYLSAKYGNGNYVEAIRGHQLFLDHKTIESKRLDAATITADAREFIIKMSGVSDAYTIQEIVAQSTPHLSKIRRQTNPEKAGDIYIEYTPGWSVTDDMGNGKVTNVRLSAVNTPAFILAPARVAATTIETPVDATALAPTVCSVLRIRSPNGASTRPIILPQGEVQNK